MSDISTIESWPVELLRDQRGVYGIGVTDLFDLESVALSCGIETEPYAFGDIPTALVLRPDRLGVDGLKPHRAVLQKITGGFRRGPFMRTHEERLRQFIHHKALERAGLPWPPPDNGHVRWWSEDKKQQARNRGVYHGLRQLSLCVINDLIGKALEQAADADAVRAARRFTFGHREDVYRASALSRRALQLTETFPVLALQIYSHPWRLRGGSAERRRAAAQLVDRGTRLRDVAAAMDVPIALRHIKPGVAHLATDVFCLYPEILSYMPDTTSRQRIWLFVVDWAYQNCQKIGADFDLWAARHVAEISGRSHREVGAFLANISDWVTAGGAGAAGSEFVTRAFTPSMSLKTVSALSAEWHEAVANNLDGPNAAFPPPWFPAAKIGNTEIVPIEDAATLYREGSAMHHCVGTYRDRVQSGEFYVYSMRRDGERVATLALGRYDRGGNGNVYLEQIRGACNIEPPKEIIATVRRWLRAQKPSQAPALMGVAG
jgi:hypothetical protein